MNEINYNYISKMNPELGLETKSLKEIHSIIMDYIKFGTGYGEFAAESKELLCRALNAKDSDFVWLTTKDRYLLETIKGKTKDVN